ncbi:o128 [Anopheles sinensis]|uniref:O128 n=1 Tax=Anopheles sinensis TaxID=74873 RepID=A0A084WPZ9_ANOSI|nr:o128 [Anopheles sinensis]
MRCITNPRIAKFIVAIAGGADGLPRGNWCEEQKESRNGIDGSRTPNLLTPIAQRAVAPHAAGHFHRQFRIIGRNSADTIAKLGIFARTCVCPFCAALKRVPTPARASKQRNRSP